jgi:glycosyltransferase involved in cell wall biosynthesis
MNMREPDKLVSVIISCYNYGGYLADCVESALAQTYKNIEVIVVNDGSTDNTDDVMQRYLSDSRIRYISQKNAGQANAKNTGIKNARGAFLAFLDADDRWEADKLEKQIPLFSDPSVGVVYCRAKYIDQDGREFDYNMTSHYLQPRRGHVTEWLIFDNFIQFSSTVVRKECIDQLGGQDESLNMGTDWDHWLRISTKYRFDFADEQLFYYRMGHTGQMSRNKEERQRCSDRIMATFIKNHPNVLSAQTVRRAYAFTFCNRGEYLRSRDMNKSNRYFMDAVLKNPCDGRAYKGLLKNILFACGISGNDL